MQFFEFIGNHVDAVVALLVAVSGWIIEARTRKKAIKDSRNEFESQLAALEAQAQASKDQAQVMQDEARVPKWEIFQKAPKSIAYVLKNLNTFDAFNVTVSYDAYSFPGQEVSIGTLTKGSSKTVELMSTAISGGLPDNIVISWTLSEDSTDVHEFTLAMPARL